MHEELSYEDRILALNDAFRTSGVGGQVVISAGVQEQGHGFLVRALEAVREYKDFDDEDPYTEHDHGSVEIDGIVLNFYIDCYDRSLRHRSPDPSDPEATVRILTIMLSSEYWSQRRNIIRR